MGFTVLVTGATGFIAKHCIAELIRQGYTVCGTARHSDAHTKIVRAVERSGLDASGVEIREADLLRDDGWDAALDGCSHVLHVASPFPIKPPRNRDDVVRPAVDGTLRVLQAAARAGVQRVVMTSSLAACIYPSAGEQERTYTEADWTDVDRGDISPYVVSKTLAEHAAWDFVRLTPNAPELTVINPGFVQGPALDLDLSTSHEVLALMANGKYPAAPRAGYAVVDVRDVAAAHVAAMTHPAAAGERFLVTSGYATLLEIAKMLAHALPDTASRVPRREAPDFIIRSLSFFDRSLLAVLPDLSTRRECSNAKARETLGITFRPAREAVTTAAKSLRELGAI